MITHDFQQDSATAHTKQFCVVGDSKQKIVTFARSECMYSYMWDMLLYKVYNDKDVLKKHSEYSKEAKAHQGL